MEVPEYHLPATAVAQEPIEPRHDSRLLVSTGNGAELPGHRHVRDLPELLEPGDLLVINTTRVIPARLRLAKRTGGAAEVLLLEPEGETGVESREWTALVRPGRRLPPGTVLYHCEQPVLVTGADLGEGRRRVTLTVEGPVTEFLDRVGAVPLPPYIHRRLLDPARYQTVYADRPGSVAAPTAGLHLSTEVLDRCRSRGVAIADVDLAVGLGTFRPLSTEGVEDHVMHRERYRVPEPTMAACRQARRVVAVGTTTLRALESAAATGRLAGDTGLYIYGDFDFLVVDVLLTNFHQPRSSLLVLLEAFCGPRWRELYRIALADGYRFLSFGDAMLVDRRRDR